MSMTFVDSVADLLTPEEITAMSGLEFLQGIAEGRLPAPPICKALNYWMKTVEEGRVVFEAEPRFEHMNPIGSVHGGWFGTLLDSAMACAVQSMLPAGRGYTTLEYKVNILRPVLPDTGLYEAIGTVDHVGRRTGVAHGEIRSLETGKLHATGSTTCIAL